MAFPHYIIFVFLCISLPVFLQHIPEYYPERLSHRYNLDTNFIGAGQCGFYEKVQKNRYQICIIKKLAVPLHPLLRKAFCYPQEVRLPSSVGRATDS